jgi:hypothetical protein
VAAWNNSGIVTSRQSTALLQEPTEERIRSMHGSAGAVTAGVLLPEKRCRNKEFWEENAPVIFYMSDSN